MRARRGIRYGFFASLVALAASTAAHAQLFVVAPDAAPPAVEHAELVYALGDGSPITWLAVRAERGPLALVAALPEGAHVGSGLDAWLASLEATASLNVLPPSTGARCPEGAGFARVAWPRDRSSAPTELVLETSDDVAAALSELGLETPKSLPNAASYLVWAFPEPEGTRTTRTLRVEGAALALDARGSFPVLVNAVTRGSQSYPGEVPSSELEVTFSPGKRAGSDYAERLRSWLAGGGAPILELRARGALFDWSIYEETLSSAPLVQSYAERAASELDGDLEAKPCARQLALFRTQAAPETPACGEAVDAALALTASGPELSTLQRWAISSERGVDPAVLFGGGEAAEPLLVARGLSAMGCEAEPLPPIVRDPPIVVREPDPPVEEVVIVDDHVDEDVTVEVGCWGEPRTTRSNYEDDDTGCASDTSSSADTSDDADCASDTSSSADTSDDADCASDTSSSADTSDDADCASDTSSSADTSDDADCASDSSSSSDSDSGCGSDTSSTSDEDSGYDGDTCAGSAAPRAERSRSQQASLTRGRKPKRLKTSLWSVGFVALVLPIRRRKRGPARSG